MIKVVGIVNCSPDSFSDGADALSHPQLLVKAKGLIDEGADLLDIGGDSTRPGSLCCGTEEEWRRIAPILKVMAKEIPCSVDTHSPEIAKRAIQEGASFINDVSGCFSDEMASTISSSPASFIFMFNAHGGAHLFGDGLPHSNYFSRISTWLGEHCRKLEKCGIGPERLIADPGMGAFLSSNPRVSSSVIERFHELPGPAGGLLLGCSRKGFLARPGERSPRDRDRLSAIAGAFVAERLGPARSLYLRVHNVGEQRRVLDEWPSMNSSEKCSWFIDKPDPS